MSKLSACGFCVCVVVFLLQSPSGFLGFGKDIYYVALSQALRDNFAAVVQSFA